MSDTAFTARGYVDRQLSLEATNHVRRLASVFADVGRGETGAQAPSPFDRSGHEARDVDDSTVAGITFSAGAIAASAANR